MEMITPIEYVNDKYHEREVVVWHGDFLVHRIAWLEEGEFHRKGYNVFYQNDDYRCHKVDTYDHCLRVEPIDNDVFRQRLHGYIDQIPEDELLDLLEELQTSYDVKIEAGD